MLQCMYCNVLLYGETIESTKNEAQSKNLPEIVPKLYQKLANNVERNMSKIYYETANGSTKDLFYRIRLQGYLYIFPEITSKNYYRDYSRNCWNFELI